MTKRTLLVLAIGIACHGLGCSEARCESAAEIFARGQSQVAAGNLDDGLKTLAAAVAADPINEEYTARFERLRKAVALRKQLDTEEDAAQWTQIARALHLFYHREKLYEAALEIDRQLHKRLQAAVSATLLAQTLMAMDRNAEAAETLQEIPEDQRELGSQSSLVIALARAGKMKKAAKLAKEIPVPEHLCPGKAYMLARMNAAIGDEPAAASLLKQAFSVAPAPKLPAFKAAALRCPELAALLEKDEYKELLDTQSLVIAAPDHDHDHVGGHCATCPSQARVDDIAVKSDKDCEGCDGECDGECKKE